MVTQPSACAPGRPWPRHLWGDDKSNFAGMQHMEPLSEELRHLATATPHE